MIQVNVSEVKNRLSYYLRLVKGGEQVEILDRKTPLARLIHVSQVNQAGHETPWIGEMERLGVVSPPLNRGLPADFLAGKGLVSKGKKGKPGVLKALLDEREGGR